MERGMSDTGREIGDILAAQLETYQAEIDRLQRPYAEAAELRRRVAIAQRYVDDLPCRCDETAGLGECAHCYLTRVLAGDE